MYVTPAQLIDGPDSLNELSELFGVGAALLRAVVDGQDTSAWLAADVATAQSALVSIDQRIVQAGGEIDARLAQRGYPLPMDPVQFPILAVWARAIARYHLHPQRDRTSTETGRIERDYKDAIRALDLVATGELSLGANDPLGSALGGAVRVAGNPRLFSRNILGRL